MDTASARRIPQSTAWACALVVVVLVCGLVARSVFSRANRMKTVNISASAFSSLPAGSSTQAVVRLDQVAGQTLRGRLLEKKKDMLYVLPPATPESRILAFLNPTAAVVMGSQTAIVPGATVQLAGTIDSSHALHVDQVVILTGYVRVEDAEAR